MRLITAVLIACAATSSFAQHGSTKCQTTPDTPEAPENRIAISPSPIATGGKETPLVMSGVWWAATW